MNNYEHMGFMVVWTGDDAAPAIFYGKRGAAYGAMRRNASDEWCFLVDAGRRTPGKMRSIKGNGWVRIPIGTQSITGAR